jgi:enoyl-CoA hydratase
MVSNAVRLEVLNYIAVVTLDRPPANALDISTRSRITEIFDELTDRRDVRVAVLTGAGKLFCAGADLKDRPATESPGQFWRYNRVVRETGNAIKECAKPVIAAINGPALGAGLSLAASCDIMLASEDAYVGMPEINVGLAGGAAMLEEHFGRSRLRRMLYTGMRIPAAELHRLGIIEASLPPEQLMPEALKIAAEIVEKNPLGIRYAKLSANMAKSMPARDAYRFEQNYTVELSRTENAREARQAFIEKRKPVFKDE